MITVEVVLAQVPGLPRSDLERWILNDWVRPDGPKGAYGFHDIDVARVRLIQLLKDDLEIEERALPIVLLLLDQLYDLRRKVKQSRTGRT